MEQPTLKSRRYTDVRIDLPGHGREATVTHYPFGEPYLPADIISKDKEYYYWRNGQSYRLNEAVIRTEIDMQGNIRLTGLRGEATETTTVYADSFCAVEPYDGSNRAIFLSTYDYLYWARRKVADITDISLEMVGMCGESAQYFVKITFPDVTLTAPLNDFFKNGYQRLSDEWDEEIGILLGELVGRLLKEALLSGGAKALNIKDANTAVLLLRPGEAANIYDLYVYYHPNQDEDCFIIDWNHNWYDVNVNRNRPFARAIHALIRYCEE